MGSQEPHCYLRYRRWDCIFHGSCKIDCNMFCQSAAACRHTSATWSTGRLTLAWTFTHPILRTFRKDILEAAAHEWPSVPRQRLHEEDPFLYTVVWAYALDNHKSPTFLVIPNDAQSIMLLRVDTQKSYDLQSGIRCFGPLPGRCMENYPIL